MCLLQGTGKEYIGDDVEEIATAVKRALMSCCNQLRVKLQHRSDVSNRASRRKELFKVLVRVCAMLSLLQDHCVGFLPVHSGHCACHPRRVARDQAAEDGRRTRHWQHRGAGGVVNRSTDSLNHSVGMLCVFRLQLLKGLSTGAITESILSQRLKEAVEKVRRSVFHIFHPILLLHSRGNATGGCGGCA